jgi:hypothetical protein
MRENWKYGVEINRYKLGTKLGTKRVQKGYRHWVHFRVQKKPPL